MDIQEINQSSPEFLYQMLGRLEADCLYYLGNGAWMGKIISRLG